MHNVERQGDFLVIRTEGRDSIAVPVANLSVICDKNGQYCDIASPHGHQWRFMVKDSKHKTCEKLFKSLIKTLSPPMFKLY